MFEQAPPPEKKEKGVITKDEVLAVFRALREKGLKDPEDYENPDVDAAQKLLADWTEQEEEIAKNGTAEQRLERALSHATFLIDAGFADPEANRSMLEERAEWLIQDYDGAVAAGSEKLAQEILNRIHQIDDILGETRFNPEETEESVVLKPVVAEVGGEGFEERVKKLETACQALIERPNDSEANEQTHNLLKSEAFVRGLTDELPSRGYIDATNNRGFTFIKLTDEISLYGESDSSSFKFDRIEILATDEARARIARMETDKDLKKEH